LNFFGWSLRFSRYGPNIRKNKGWNIFPANRLMLYHCYIRITVVFAYDLVTHLKFSKIARLRWCCNWVFSEFELLCIYALFRMSVVLYEVSVLKVKVNLSLCFNWAQRHGGVLGEWRYSSTHSLTSALDGGEWSASRPGRFTPRERAPRTHWIGGWVGPRAVLDAVVKRKISSPRRESNPRTPIVQPVSQQSISVTKWIMLKVLGEKWDCKTREMKIYGVYFHKQLFVIWRL
jgi:hypothetical protein